MNIETMRTLITRTMAPTIRRVNGMIKRGVVRRVTDTAFRQNATERSHHQLQLSLGVDEVADEVEHLQPFGLSFVPPAGAEVAALAVGGNNDYLLALGALSREHIPGGRRTAPGAAPTPAEAGEGGLYNLDGWKVFLDAAGNVFIGGDAAGATVKIARADRVEAELAAIRTTLDSLTGGSGAPAEFGTPYMPDPGGVGSSKVWVAE